MREGKWGRKIRQMDEIAAREEAQQRKALWEQALAASEFASGAAFLAAAMDPAEKQKRYQALAAWQADRKAAEAALEEQKHRLEGRIRPDLTEMKGELTAAEDRSRSLEQRCILDEKLLKDMTSDGKKLAIRLEANREALLQLEADQVFARPGIKQHKFT